MNAAHIPELYQVESAIYERVQVIRQYDGADLLKHLDQLLSLMQLAYMHRLADADPADVARPQNALRQVMALKATLAGSPGAAPLI